MKINNIIYGMVLGCMLTACADAIVRAKNANDVREYRDRLEECKDKGKDARSLDVYERCARGVDKQYGVKSSDADGGLYD